MDNASLILETLDRRLDHAVRLILYGRAALQLGFVGTAPDVAQSLDVDAIIPVGDLPVLTEDESFWDAQVATNADLLDRGLYITHLFPSDFVFLRRSWEAHLVPIERPPTRWLRLFRPATIDLVLTKMMRGDDAQDLADAAFLISHDRLTRGDLEVAFAEAMLTDIPELHDAFARARPRVLSLAVG